MQLMSMFANKAGINQDKRLGTTAVDDLDKLHRMDQNRTYSFSVLRRGCVVYVSCAVSAAPGIATVL